MKDGMSTIKQNAETSGQIVERAFTSVAQCYELLSKDKTCIATILNNAGTLEHAAIGVLEPEAFRDEFRDEVYKANIKAMTAAWEFMSILERILKPTNEDYSI